jgi:hypothetical protein
MESYPDNFETGNWTVREVVRRPRTRFFSLLSCVWLVVSAGASFPFWHGWPDSFSETEWFCALIIGLEVVFVVMAIMFRFTELPRAIRERRRILECVIGRHR